MSRRGIQIEEVEPGTPLWGCGCDSPMLMECDGAILTPGDTVPAGRCANPDCELLIYPDRPQDRARDAAGDMLAALRSIQRKASEIAASPSSHNRGWWEAAAKEAGAAIAQAETRDATPAAPVRDRLAGLLALADRVAVGNAGPVKNNGHDYIAISRADFEALMALRGTPEEVLARMPAAVDR